MKILFWSDLHAHNWEQFSRRLETGRNSRLQDCLNVIQHVQDLVVSRKLDATIFMGDLFHARNKVDVDVYTSVYNSLARLSKVSGHRPILLVGNHDQYSRVGDVHSLAPLEKICNVVSSPQIHGFSSGVSVAMFPHTTDVAKLKSSINCVVEKESCPILCIHQAVKEGRIGPADVTLTEVPLSIYDLHLDKFKYVFAGDFHKRQWIQNFHYIGSPLQLTFGERDETKAFTILDTDTWECEEVETNAPKFYIFKSLEEYKEAQTKKDYSNDFVRIEAHTSADVDKIKQEHPEAQAMLKTEQQELARVSKDALTHDYTLLSAYVNQNPQWKDNATLLELGMSYLVGTE